MAVLVEAISVIVLRERIEAVYPGGWAGFAEDCPNGTLCADRDLARVGFMAPADVEAFVRRLEVAGLVFRKDDKAVDMVVVDQMRGPLTRCDWVEFGHVGIDGHRVAACRFAGSSETVVITPEGWRYEESLTADYGFVPSGSEGKSLHFLRREWGMDVYLNRLTGQEVYVGRGECDEE